ncbi:uncharacterized protein LOC117782748 [Drosophila innubila]|uniref:uncharacterized protein LOC117782748 n=1 Tax=Drosophila innubila TaxID=198719 RepID=UPI00148C40E2|nr:uncharacterized protein LOC117782748 [Drosophila innubila]
MDRFLIPVVCGLIHNLENLKGKLSTDEDREACNCLVEGIKKRLLPYEKRSVTRISTLLDPRSKREGFFSTFNASDAEKCLETELSSLNSALHRSSLSSATSLPTPISTTQQPLFEFLDKNISQRTRNSRVDSILTLRQYFNNENLESSLSPLDYWKISNDKTFKISVKKFLCVPATSTESERMFSKAGLIVSDKRSSLKPKHVDMLIFTNKNE